MVAVGQFREDLWYRLAVFPIVIPPLRERREDIPELARHFALRAATRFGLYPAEPTHEDIELLIEYAWPGNVRELATVIDRAAILGDGKLLEIAKSLGVPSLPMPVKLVAAEPPPPMPKTAAEIVPLDEIIRRHIEATLTATGGRIEGSRGAAQLLENQSAHAARADAQAQNRMEAISGVADSSSGICGPYNTCTRIGWRVFLIEISTLNDTIHRWRACSQARFGQRLEARIQEEWHEH